MMEIIDLLKDKVKEKFHIKDGDIVIVCYKGFNNKTKYATGFISLNPGFNKILLGEDFMLYYKIDKN